jgi:hypothetical protein
MRSGLCVALPASPKAQIPSSHYEGIAGLFCETLSHLARMLRGN